MNKCKILDINKILNPEFSDSIKTVNTDFYCRYEDYNKYIVDVYEITDELSILLTQIEDCLFTQKNQVLGYHEFGVNLEDLMFTLKRNESEIKNKILDQIYAYCPLASKYAVDVKLIFQKTETRDIGFIDIIINDSRAIGLII
jgi:hypothetical protein